MTRIVWGEKPPAYDFGLDRGVLYFGEAATPWSGLVSVVEQDTGAINVDHYFDGVRIHISQFLGDFQAQLSAFTYPAEVSGHMQQGPFQLTYRTQNERGYLLHLVYQARINHTAAAYNTVRSEADADLFAWDIYTSQVDVPGASPSAHLVVESLDESLIVQLEDILYGTDVTDPRFPTPDEVVELYEDATLLRVRYLGDGAYSVSGPDEMVQVNEDGSFVINAPSVFDLGPDVFVVSSH